MMYENWAKLEEVCRYFPFNPVMDIEIYKEKVHKWANNYESNTYFHWVIEWKENHELIGTINLGNVEESCFMSDTCYMLSPQYWGQSIILLTLRSMQFLSVISKNKFQFVGKSGIKKIAIY